MLLMFQNQMMQKEFKEWTLLFTVMIDSVLLGIWSKIYVLKRKVSDEEDYIIANRKGKISVRVVIVYNPCSR